MHKPGIEIFISTRSVERQPILPCNPNSVILAHRTIVEAVNDFILKIWVIMIHDKVVSSLTFLSERKVMNYRNLVNVQNISRISSSSSLPFSPEFKSADIYLQNKDRIIK